jgi:ankyrin repeat protein
LDLGGADKLDLNFCTLMKKKNVKNQIEEDEDKNFRIFPIMTCVAKGKVQMLNLMLQHKTVDIDSRDTNSRVTSFWLACLYGHGKIMKILAENGAEVYITNQQKVNVLHLAVYKNHISIAEMLISSNFDLSRETNLGMTALMLASALNRIEIVKKIISHIYDSNFKKSFNQEIISKINHHLNLSALSMAILTKNKDLAIKLIQAGANSYFDHNSA